MKSNKILAGLLVLATFAVGCNKVEPEVTPDNENKDDIENVGKPDEKPVVKTYTAIISQPVSAESKALVDEDGVFSWQGGEWVRIFDENGSIGEDNAEIVFTEGVATFSTTVDSPKWAVYPRVLVDGGNTLDKVWMQYGYGDATAPLRGALYAPMIADLSNEGGVANFRHIAGVMKVSFTNVPPTVNKFRFTAKDKGITGEFNLVPDPNNETFSISALEVCDITDNGSVRKNNHKEFYFTHTETATDLNVYVPLPVGTYNGIKVELFAGDEMVMEKETDKSYVIARRMLAVLPPFEYGTNETSLTVSRTYFAPTFAAGEVKFDIDCGAGSPWTIDLGDAGSWCSASQTSGTGPATVTLTLADIENGVANGKIVVKNNVSQETIEIQHGYAQTINGITWAMANVDQPNRFCVNIDDRGKLYQYSSKVPWPNAGGEEDLTTPEGYPTGAVAYESSGWNENPCPEGWTIPTIEQIQNLLGGNVEINKEYISYDDPTTPNNWNILWKDNTELSGFAIHGAIAGINQETAENVVKGNLKRNGGIFIPQAGYRENTGEQKDWWGACFTSSSRPTQDAYWDYYIFNTNFNGWLHLYAMGNRAAFPVRCVAKPVTEQQ